MAKKMTKAYKNQNNSVFSSLEKPYQKAANNMIIKTLVQYLYSLGLLFTFQFLSCSGPEQQSPVQSSDSQAVTTTHKEGETPKPELSFEYTVPQEIAYINNPEIIYDRFYPIGFSPSGKFAYITEPADQATGYYFFSLIIQDLTTDKTLYTWTLDSEDAVEEGDLKSTWEKNKDIFIKELTKYEIQQTTLALKPVSFESANHNFQLKMTTETAADENFGIEVVSKASIILSRDKKESKTVYKKKFTDSMILSCGIAGQLKSPFEERIAVIHYQLYMGYEGPPHVCSVMIAGAGLQDDFK